MGYMYDNHSKPKRIEKPVNLLECSFNNAASNVTLLCQNIKKISSIRRSSILAYCEPVWYRLHHVFVVVVVVVVVVDVDDDDDVIKYRPCFEWRGLGVGVGDVESFA